jgi:hypothetical protein
MPSEPQHVKGLKTLSGLKAFHLTKGSCLRTTEPASKLTLASRPDPVPVLSQSAQQPFEADLVADFPTLDSKPSVVAPVDLPQPASPTVLSPQDEDFGPQPQQFSFVPACSKQAKKKAQKAQKLGLQTSVQPPAQAAEVKSTQPPSPKPTSAACPPQADPGTLPKVVPTSTPPTPAAPSTNAYRPPHLRGAGSRTLDGMWRRGL